MLAPIAALALGRDQRHVAQRDARVEQGHQPRLESRLAQEEQLVGEQQVGPALSFAKLVSGFGWVRLSLAFFRDLGGPARKNERGQLSRNLRVSFRVADPWIQMLYPPT